MREASTVAAYLLTEAYVPIKDLPELTLDQGLFTDVKSRLAAVGMELVESAFSTHYSVRPLPEAKMHFMEGVSNVRLTDREHALLVVMWAKLMWPQRQNLPGPHRVASETVVAEFGAMFGGKQNLLQALGRLTTLGFLVVEEGLYVSGPQMSAAIDHQELSDYIRDRALLVEVGARARAMVDTGSRTAHQAVRIFFSGTDQKLPPREVTRLLELDPELVKAALHDLYEDDFLDRQGQGKSMVYWRKHDVSN